MDHPLATTASSFRSEGSDQATPTNSHLPQPGPWGDLQTGEGSSFDSDKRANAAPADDYKTRLSRLLDDDDDIGQDRDSNQWAEHDRELQALDQTMKSRELGYFDDSGKDSLLSWARDDFQNIPSTTLQNSLPVTPPTFENPKETWTRAVDGVESPARSSYRRPSYLHPSISRLRAHDRKISTSSAGSNANPFGLSPSKLGHDRAPSTASRRSVVSRQSSTMGPLVSNSLIDGAPEADRGSERASSLYGGNSIDSGLPIQAEEYRNRTAFAFQTLRTATDILWPTARDGHNMSPIPRSGIFGLNEMPAKKKRFSIASAVGGRGPEESVAQQLQEKDRGRPVILDVKGVIAVGTDAGWVIVFNFEQEAQCICGMDTISHESGPVTALTVSPDGTFVAVGHSNGNVYLYDLKYPSRPARSALALPSAQLMSGRKEGHLIGTRIVDIDFVGSRHTAIVTSDETGRAFWWSLGRVMGVESNDVVRLLGGLPDGSSDKVLASNSGTSTPEIDNTGAKGGMTRMKSKGSTLFAGKVLPSGKSEHPSDTYHLTAFLTPSKMVIVGLKPTPRIWFRRSRGLEGGDKARTIGCVAWLPAGSRIQRKEGEEVNEVAQSGSSASAQSDPVLAYSWGGSLRLIRVKSDTKDDQDARKLAFEEILHRREDQPVLAINWLNPEHLLIATPVHLSLVDIRDGQRIEHSQYSMLSRLSWNPTSRRNHGLAGRLRVHKGKIFMLAEADLRAGSLLLWADRILALCHAGDFLSAIQLAVAYYTGTASGNTIGLPSDPSDRRTALKARALSLMESSLAYAFSQDRLTDGTYDSPDGRGVDLTPLFEGLVDTCLTSCLIMDATSFAYEEVYEAYLRAGIQGIYLAKLEKTLLETRLREVPPNLIQALIQTHDDAGEYKKAEDVIWHVEPASLDINQAITLCERNGLWDAYAYVYNQCMLDYVTPVAKFISLMRPPGAGRETIDSERLPQAYTLFQYLEATLMGREYPDGRILPDDHAHQARRSIYGCLLSRENTLSRQTQLVVGLEAGAFPVLRTILHYDTEALLHVLDIAFEDGYLNELETFASPSRQAIVDALIEVMTPDRFPVGDITFMHIFVARNLPKYPQFIRLPPVINQNILASLGRDPDMTSREDRQLAAEHLLSVYTPPDIEERRVQFMHAQFYRILRSDYASANEWHNVVRCIVDDPDLEKEEVFEELRGTLKPSTSSMGLATIRDRLEQLLTISVPLTARLLDDYTPGSHPAALALLQTTPVKQFAYLGALLQPEMLDEDLTGERAVPQLAISTHLDQSCIQTYIRLLCQMAPQQLLPFIQDYRASLDLGRTIETCERQQVKAVVIWAMDANGDSAGAIHRLNEYLDDETASTCKEQDDGRSEAADLEISHRLAIVSEMVAAGILVCTRAEKVIHNKLSTENLWFDLLAAMVRLTQRALHCANNNSSLEIAGPRGQTSGAALLVETLRRCIQDTLAALISSSTSSTLSFPRLFRRLVGVTGSGADVDESSVYSEFRLILVSMLDTYHSEEDLLVLVTKLVQRDVFDCMVDMVKSRNAGWRVEGLECDRCKTRFHNAEGEADAVVGADLICVPMQGQPYHWACDRRSEAMMSV